MKSTISGIFRLILTMALLYAFGDYFYTTYTFSQLISLKLVNLIAPFIVFQLSCCMILYSGVNTIRQFQHKKVSFVPMYVVNTIMVILFSVYFAKEVMGRFGKWNLERGVYDAFYLLMVYFTIADFVAFVTRKKEPMAGLF